jgi:large subunit ribosomal protein L13
MGDYVIVVNAERVTVTGTKTTSKKDSKIYYRHSGYPGGLKSISLRDQLNKNPDRVLRSAVWGMLPHNRMGRSLLKRLKVYAGPDHPHGMQQPEPLA